MTDLLTLETRRARVERDLAHAQTMLAQAASDRSYQRHLRRVHVYRATLANLAEWIADTAKAVTRDKASVTCDAPYLDEPSLALIPARFLNRF